MDWGLWPLVVERLDADPSRADDILALADIADAMGCALDADGGFPAELLELARRGPVRPSEGPPPLVPPPVRTEPAPATGPVVDLSSPGRERGSGEMVDLSAAEDGSFSWTPESERPARSRLRQAEATRLVPRIIPRRATAAPSAAPADPDDPERGAADQPEPVADPGLVDLTRAPNAETDVTEAPPTGTPEAPDHSDRSGGPRARDTAIGIARVVATIVAGLILLAIVWRAGTGIQPDDPPASSAPAASTSASPVVEGTTVPDVLGDDVDTATATLEGAGLEVDRVVVLDRQAREVTRTEPTPGEAVAVGSDVVLYVGEAGSG
jgi:hypothetical protein